MCGSPLRRTGVIGSVVWMQRCDLHDVARAAHAGESLKANGLPDSLTVYPTLHRVTAWPVWRRMYYKVDDHVPCWMGMDPGISRRAVRGGLRVADGHATQSAAGCAAGQSACRVAIRVQGRTWTS